MKITVEEINSVQRRVNLTISKEIVNRAFDKTFTDIQKKAQVQGFRPGKAPIKIIRKLYSDRAAYDTTDRLIKDNLFVALDENKLNPVAMPYVESEELAIYDQDYDVKAVIDVLPAVSLNGAHKGLQVKVRELQVDDSSVEKELKRLCRNKARISPIEDENVEAALGQMISIEVKALTKDGVDSRMSSNGTERYLLGGSELAEEFEKALLGKKKGSVVEVKSTAPKDSDVAPAGEELTFELTIKDIQNANLPALDDELAKDMGLENLAQLREKVRNEMVEYAKNTNNNSLLESLVRALQEKVEIEVPPALVDQNIDFTIRKMVGEKNAGMAQKFLKDEKIRENLRPNARKEVQTSILLREIVKEEKLDQGLAEAHSHEHVHDENCNHDHDHDHAHEDAREAELIDRIREFLQKHASVEKESVTL